MFYTLGNDIYITRGDTGTFSVNLTNNGQAYDYSNDALILTVRRNVHDPEVLIQKTIVYGENVAIEPADTQKMLGVYWYDVQLTTAGGTIDTVIPPSKFIVMADVT